MGEGLRTKKQVVITEEQWEKTVDNWVNRVIGKPTYYGCGFCAAIAEDLTCADCPADDEICDDEVVSWYGCGGSIEKALEVLEWLYDFGKIAGWC